ncbi:MAG: methylmalonyl-CoA mutase family protein, partial [Pseudomonadota bacterium]
MSKATAKANPQTPTASAMPRDWLDLASKEMKGGDPQTLVWNTPEGIAVKPLYTADDLAHLPHLTQESLPGQAPFTRG